MKSRRTAKIAQAILESVSSAILFGLKDPRVKNVTIVHVDVSPDVRTAKIYVSVMGDEKTQSLCMHGLNSARGFLQSKCADRIQTRYTPVFTFVLDESVKKSGEAARILRDLLPDSTGSDKTHSGNSDVDPGSREEIRTQSDESSLAANDGSDAGHISAAGDVAPGRND